MEKNELKAGQISVYVSKGNFTDKNTGEEKLVVGFGDKKPYDNQDVTPKDVFDKLSHINAYLSANGNARKLPITLKGKEPESGKDYFMSANSFVTQKANEYGEIEYKQKLAINLDEKTTVFATKLPKSGFAFDNIIDENGKGKNDEKIERFKSYIKDGVDFTLGANKASTLKDYDVLMKNLDKFEKSSQNIIEFQKGKGAVLVSVLDNSKDKVADIQAPVKESPVKKAKKEIDKNSTKSDKNLEK